MRTESEQHKEQYTESNKSQHTHTQIIFLISAHQQIFNRLVVRGCPHSLHTCTLLHTRLHNHLSAERRNTCRQLNMLHIPIQQNNLQPCVLMCNLCLHGFTLQFRVSAQMRQSYSTYFDLFTKPVSEKSLMSIQFWVVIGHSLFNPN